MVFLDQYEDAAWQDYNVRLTLPMPVWHWIDSMRDIEMNRIRKGLHKGSYTTLIHHLLNLYRAWVKDRAVYLAFAGKVGQEDISLIPYIKWYDFSKAYVDNWAFLPELMLTKRIHWYVNPSNQSLIDRSADVMHEHCPRKYSISGVPSSMAALFFWAYMRYCANEKSAWLPFEKNS
jgi:hypothetical protein